MEIDIPVPRNAHVNVELYFGWRRSGTSMSFADDRYVVPATGRHNNQENKVEVRRNASFWVVR